MSLKHCAKNIKECLSKQKQKERRDIIKTCFDTSLNTFDTSLNTIDAKPTLDIKPEKSQNLFLKMNGDSAYLAV